MRPLTRDALRILIALTDKPRHGYGIMQDVDERSNGQVVLQAGALYRTLKRMLADGIIEECDAPANADTDDSRRRYYKRTALGATVLAAETQRLSQLVTAAKHSQAGRRPRLA